MKKAISFKIEYIFYVYIKMKFFVVSYQQNFMLERNVCIITIYVCSIVALS